MQIEEWMTVSGASPAEFREATGFNDEQARRYRRRERVPNRDAMARTFIATSGWVRPDDFFDLPTLEGPAADREALYQGVRCLLEDNGICFEHPAQVSECLSGIAAVLSMYRSVVAESEGGSDAPTTAREAAR